MTGIDGRPARLSSALSAGAALVVAGIIAVLGLSTTVVLGVVGAVCLAGGTVALGRENNAARAGGSVAASLGAFAALGGVGIGAGGSIPGTVAAVSLPLGLAATALGVTATLDGETLSPLRSVFGIGAGVTSLMTVLAAMVHTGSIAAPVSIATDLFGGAVAALTSTDFARLATLFVLVGVAAVLAHFVTEELPDRVFARFDGETTETLSRLRRPLFRLGVATGLLGIVLTPVAAVLPEPTPATALFRALPGPLGGLVRWLSTSLVVHFLVVLACLIAGGWLAVRAIRRSVDRTRPDDVGAPLARAAGGVVVAVLIPLAADPIAARLLDRLPDAAASAFQTGIVDYGLGTAVLGVAVAGFGLSFLVASVTAVGVSIGLVPREAGGVALGAGLLFVTALAAADGPAGPLTTFVAVGAAFLVWDFGEYATVVGRELGRTADTTRGQVVHAGASTLVVGCAIAFAYASGLAASRVTLSAPGWALFVAAVCSLVAAFLLLPTLRG